ncbi:Sucrose/H+ symporter, plant [Penicillium digitatum]|uniref:Sucrose/H+ symporter, plant n=1 Tax=Penicillium digitatum TaxID=36651 RepID=A0A7T6XTT3_PENDI|nr:Sucrose/H+ symporter, plant [Penicillium digitatum]
MPIPTSRILLCPFTTDTSLTLSMASSRWRLSSCSSSLPAWPTSAVPTIQGLHRLRRLRSLGYPLFGIYSCDFSRREILFLAPIVGLWICCVREFKCSHLFLAFPLMTLGTSLKVHFRDSDSDIGYMSMCQTCITFASDIMVVVPLASPAETAKDQWAALNVGGYVAQMKFLPGTEERDAINFVYDYSPMYGHIAAMAILVFTAP